MTPTINVPITYTTITVPVQTQTIYASVTNGISTPASVGTGTVTGPSSSVANNFASFLDTKGQIIKDSGYSAASFIKQGNNALTKDLDIDGGTLYGFNATSMEYFAIFDKNNVNLLELNDIQGLTIIGGTVWSLTNNFNVDGAFNVGFGQTTPISNFLATMADGSSFAWGANGNYHLWFPVGTVAATIGDSGGSKASIQFLINVPGTNSLNFTVTGNVSGFASFNASVTQAGVSTISISSNIIKFLPTVAPIVGQVITATNVDGSWTWQNVAGGNPFADNAALVKNSADATKKLILSAASITTATTRTWTFPDVNGTVARIDAAQTFTGVQTFSSLPTIPVTPLVSTDAASKGYVDGLTLAVPIAANFGGTGVTNNVASTITISGAFATTFTITATTSVTLPTSGTLLANPMTTAGDIILGGSSGSGTRLAIGANTFVLTSNGTTAAWAAASGGGWAVTGSTTITGNTSQTGAFTESFLMNEVLITQNALSSGWVPALLITPGAHTAMTASTEFVAINYATFTQTWLAGTIATQRFAYFRSPTIAGASASNTVTDPYTVYIDPPIQGTNAILTNKWAFGLGGNMNVIGANSLIEVYKTFTDYNNYSRLDIGFSPYWGLDFGIVLDGKTAGVRDGGSLAIVSAGPSGIINFGTGAGYIGRITNAGYWRPASNNVYDWGEGAGNIFRAMYSQTMRLGGNAVPAAYLDLAAGTASAGNGPLHFTSGTNLTTAVAGTMEYNGTNLFFTRTGTTRENVLIGNDAAGAPATTASPTFTSFYGGNTKTLGDPNSWASVVISGTTYKIPLYT